ncbi:MAG: hypothetical protein IKH57_21240 [Clostridia bacterium]|nr:hypothetical protein [Clostridia bacterium]
MAGKYTLKGQQALSSYGTQKWGMEETEKKAGSYKKITSGLNTDKTEAKNGVNPFGVDILDKKYHQTALELYDIGKQYGSKRNPLEDAYNLTLNFAQTALKSYGLIGSKDKNPLEVADKSYDQLLRETKWDYQYSNMTHEQYQQALQGLQYQPESAIKAQNQKNVINLAKSMGEKTGSQKLADVYDQLPALARKASGDITGAWSEEEKQVWNEAQISIPWLTNAAINGIDEQQSNILTQWGYGKAQKLREQGQISYEDADKALESNPAYSFAKEHAGDLTGYAAEYDSIGDIVRRVVNQGAESLTEQEYKLVESLMPEISKITGGKPIQGFTDTDIANVSEWGNQFASQLRDMNGVFSAYQPTEEQQFILGKDRETLEGARQYYEEAKGTAEEQQAKDNLFFVGERTKFQEYEQWDDFDANTPVNREFLSDPIYAAVSGQQSTSILGTLGQTIYQGTQDTAYMTPEERGKYRWYYENVDPKTAQEYYHYLSYELADRRKSIQDAATHAAVKSSPGNALALELLTVGENQFAGILGAGDIYGQMLAKAQGRLTGPINYNTQNQNLANHVNAVRTETTAQIEQAMQNAGASDWLKNTVITIKNGLEGAADSVMGGYIGSFFGGSEQGAKWLTNLIVSSRAAQDSMQSIHDRGGDDSQAAVGGIVSGVAEWFFEQFSIEQMFSDAKKIGKQGLKGWVKSLLKEAGVNAQQEGFTGIANSIADILIMGDKSEFVKSRDEYERLGMSPEEAEQKAIEDVAIQAGQDAIGGAVMGGIVGVGTNTASAFTTSGVDKATGAVIKPDTQNILKTFGEQLGGDAAEVAKGYDPKKATNKQTGELVRTIFGQLTGEYRETLLDRVAVDLKDAGASWEAAMSIAKMMAGQELTPEEIQTLAKDQQAMQVMYETFGGGNPSAADGGASPDRRGKNQETALDDQGMMEVGPLPGYGTQEGETNAAQDQATEEKAAFDGVLTEEKTAALEQHKQETLETMRQEEKQGAKKADEAQTKERQALFESAAEQEQAAQEQAAQEQAAQKQAAQEQPTQEQAEQEPARNREEGDALSAPAGQLSQGESQGHGRVLELRVDEDSGTVEAEMEDGSTVPLAESGLNEDQQALAQEVADLPQDAQAAVTKLWEPGQNLMNLVNGFKRVFSAAAQGRNGASLYGEQLTEEQRQAAMEAGQREYERTKEEMAAKTKETLANLKKRGFFFRNLNDGASKAGGVYFARVLNRVTDAAAAQLSVIQKLAEEYGFQVRVYDHMDENGNYETGSNVINLALDAEEGMLGRTVSHELFHFVREWSQEAGDKLRTYVLNALKNAQGYDYETRKQQIMDQYKNETGKALTPEEAEEEMAAEGMLDALDTEEALHDLFTETKDKTLIEKIKNWLSDMAKSIRAAIDSLAWNHPEVRALKDQADYMQGVSDRLKAALEQAAENYRASQRGLYADAAADPDVQAYTEAIQEKGITLEDARTEADALAAKLFARAEKSWIEQHADLYEEGFEKAKAAMMEYAQGKTSMVKAFTDQGLFAPPQELFPALAYAGRQILSKQTHKYSFRSFSEQVDDLKKNKIPLEDSLYVCEAPKVFRDIGFKSLPMTIDQYHANTALKGSKPNHYIPENVFKTLPDQLKKPIAIIESAQRPDDSVIVIFDKELKTGQWMAAVEIEGIRNLNGKEYNVIPINNTMGRKNTISKLLKDAIQSEKENGNGIFYIDEKKARQLLETEGVQFPDYIPTNGLMHMITEKTTPVKIKTSMRAPTRDAAYMQALDSGDEEKAQRMVDEAARAAGYEPVVRYHQTGAEFTEFSTDNPDAGANDDETPNGIFFKENDHDIGVGGDYVKTGHGGSVQMPVYLKSENMLHFEDRKEAREWYMKNVPGYKEASEAWEKVYNEKYKPQLDAIEEEEFEPATTIERYEELDKQEEKLIEEMGQEEREYRRKTRETLNQYFIGGNSGYDGIELDYDGHRYIDGKRENVHTYIVFDPSQVKSSAAVTYDDNGNVIPLSERFDQGQKDIRFERRADTEDRLSDALVNDLQADPDFYAQAMTDEETAEAVRLFAKIYRSLESLSNDLVGKITEREDWKTRKSELAKRLITETGSKMKLKDVEAWIGRLFEALDKGGYNLGESLMYARELGMELIKKSPGMELPMDETTQSVLSALKNNKFYLTDDQKSEIRGTYGNLQTYLRTMFGKTNIVKQGSGVSDLGTFWRETLNKLDPGTFAEDTQDLDMPGILAAWLETANQPKYSSEFGQNAGHYATSIGLELMGEYLDMPWTNQRVNALKGQYDRELKNIRQNYQGKYEARVEAASERRKKTEARNKVINEIKKEVRKVRTRVMNASDSRHIPEELRGAAEAFLRIFDHDRAIFSGYEIQELANKYRLLAENGALHDTEAASAYDQDIDNYLQGLAGIMKDGGQLRNLDQNTLEMVNSIVQHIAFVFSDRNEKEINGRQVNLEREANEFMAMMRAHREAKLDKAHQAGRGLAYREMTPVYYAKRMGGIVKDVIDDMILNGQEKYAFHARDTKQAMADLVQKYNVNKWINSKNHLQFDTVQGDHLELTKEQAMTIYAWWKREQLNTLQNAAHLKLGGFTYDLNDKDTRKYKGVDLHKSHVLSQADINQIEEYLGKEGLGFVDEMVDYLSHTVSEWGNETSMALFGWKKYGENYYFPYPTDAQFRGKNLAFGSKGQNAKLKNISASHALTENAHNPLKLGNFTDIWAEHVDQMAMYNAFAEKLDNLERVTNYVNDGTTTVNEKGELVITPPESAKKLMAQAMGEEAVRYLEAFINDVNGGVRGDERGAGKKLFSLFKKGSVAANLSVMLQQPSAFVRAMSMVSPKYFVKGLNPKDLKGVKARMYANSGAAVIKDMGRFDTNMGKSSVEWMKDEINNPSKLGWAYDKMDKITGAGAEFADEITWCWMYSAIENEVEDTTNLTRGTEEFNKAVGQRFDAVMTQTQVYDSTLAKSQWMRSTGGLDKMFTSFMAEPTLWMNMLMDAAMDVAEKKPGAGKKAAAAAGVFLGGSFVNAVLKSLATALRRKDDEGRTWLEKYLAEVTGNFIEDVSPFGIMNMAPLARDAVSIVQGYDVERADMTLVSDLWKKVEKLMNKGADAEAMDWINAGAAAANIFGIPARNVIRDVQGLWGAFFGGANASGPNEGRDIWLSILDNVGDTLRIGPYSVWDSGNKAYYDRIEQALLAGDMDKYNELRGYMTDTNQVTEKSVDTGVKNEIKDSFTRGLISDDKAMKILQDQFGMDHDKAWEQVEKWSQEEEHADDEDYNYSKYREVLDLVRDGKDITAASKKLTTNTKTTEKTINSQIQSAIGEWYREGEITQQQAKEKLKKYLNITDSDDLHWLFDKWDYMTSGAEDNYSQYVDVYKAVDSNGSITAAMKEMTQYGYEEKEVKSEIKSHLGEQYRAGTITKATATAKIKKYTGITDENDLYWLFDQWDYMKKNANNKNAEDYGKYKSYYKAIEKGDGLTAETKRYLDHGVKKDTLSSAITSQYKPQYVALVKAGKTTQAAELKARILRAYEVLGYDRNKKIKDIDKWLKDQ